MQRPNIPLSTLRAFEAAARLLSFEKAASELHVTASAVSQQVARLEDRLGTPLFERQHRKVALTDAGRELSRPMIKAFGAIDRALIAAQHSAQHDSIKLAIYQTWASRWLIPRLGEFSRAFPKVDVQFETGLDQVDLERSDFDFAVRWLEARSVPEAAHALFEEILVPVCAPALAKQLGKLEDLAAVSFIRSANRPDDWSAWLAANGTLNVNGHGSLKFSNTSLALGAATTGAGVLVGQVHLFLPELASGALVMPFKTGVRTGRSLYLLASPLALQRSSNAAFMAWIVDEAQRSSAQAARLRCKLLAPRGAR